MERSRRSGMRCFRAGCRPARSARIAVVPSVEWLSTTITLKGKSVRCARALFTASATVRTRFRTGMTTLASTGKGSVRRRNVAKRRGEPGPDPLEMRRRRLLHLLLERPVPGIDVGKVAPPAAPVLSRLPPPCSFRHDGEALREMEEFTIGRDLQAEVVPAGPSAGRDLPVFPDRPAGGGRREQDQGTEIEAVAEASLLIVVHGMFPEGFAADLGIVRIDHPRPGRLGRSKQAARGAGIGPDIPGRKIEQVACGDPGKEGVPGPAGGGVIAGKRLTAGRKRISAAGVEDNDLPDQGVPEKFLQKSFIPGTGARGITAVIMDALAISQRHRSGASC